jgi:hypothetical protein
MVCRVGDVQPLGDFVTFRASSQFVASPQSAVSPQFGVGSQRLIYVVKSSKITADVRAFFTSYATAYIRQDVPAVCRHFADLIHISGDTGDRVSVHVETVTEMQKTVEHLISMYREIDFGFAEVLALAIDEMSPRLVQARLRWLLRDKAGKPLYEFDAMYTLARHAERFRITALAHNEMPQYRRCLAARREGLG